ncbi:NtaA/DmoA family FMN-dependent monooxygenase [Rhizobium sp. L1K21]|uniref:NtaA/DmoA family FMN-dependent monooxygenase n=1 Tax=Rhizobium sp. L1K21 TaxID=2954933 RepID=UPI0020936602|nr:NtaA/DmoA family FMN-dependent monooxygenase [Rhizobium sp. L1K21]MCO6187557.1 NtaA/DmoA family FMN-dependent monooxygenase [Rhizobium sp. L1K21]
MAPQKKLHIGMSLAPTWLSGEAWRREDSNVEGLFSSDFYVDIAKRSEAVHLDFVFRPDALFLPLEMIENGSGFASLDPTLLLASLARETTHIGLLSTISTIFFPPYLVARQLQTLHWLSNGRAGWNVVTALNGHDNFGLENMPSSQERYDRAEEFTAVVRQLWESFPSDALKLDRGSGRFADPEKVSAINHVGDYNRVKGPLNLPAFGKSPIPLVQAGASARGRSFAASIADAIFSSSPDMESAIELRRDLRRLAETHNRSADSVNLMPGLSLYLAESRKEADDLFRQTHARTEKARKLNTIKNLIGLDLAEWPESRRVSTPDLPPPLAQPYSGTHAELLRRAIERDQPTVAELLWRPEVMGSAHWQIIGTVDDAFEEIRNWAEAGAMDGFILLPGGSVTSMHLALEKLVPRLKDAGLFRERYASPYFADHLRA